MMTERIWRILIVGGYGVFGGRIVELLADEQRVELIIAGRSLAQAQSFCARFKGKAVLRAVRFERSGDVTAQLRSHAADLVIDASGPFQAYGDAPYRLVEAAVGVCVNYLDLADGSNFVGGISQFDGAAKEKSVFILSAVSSFPVLTAAVCRELSKGLSRVDTITGGIAPSPYAGVGLNVIRAVSSYAGNPVRVVRNGKPATAYGLTETMRATIGPPGQLPLRSRLFSLVDVPDLVVLPHEYPEVRKVWMGAGPVPEVLHRTLIGLAWSVRLRLLPSLRVMAPLFHRAVNTVRWGEHRGGMFVALEGVSIAGKRAARSWHLLAERDDGPLIPSMAVVAIVRRCLAGAPPLPGARSGVADLELGDFETIFSGRTICHGFRNDCGGAADDPMFRRLLGSAFDQLPTPIRDMHTVCGMRVATGTAEVERGHNPVSRLIGWLFGFPAVGQNVPVQVSFTAVGGSEVWKRSFGGRLFSSRQALGKGRNDKLLVETFGPFAFAMALVCTEGKLRMVVRRWHCLGVPLPLLLAPYGDMFESVCEDKFNFNVDIRLPIVGLLVRYRGSLVPQRSSG